MDKDVLRYVIMFIVGVVTLLVVGVSIVMSL